MSHPSALATLDAVPPAEATPAEDGLSLYRPYEMGHAAKQRFTLDLIDPGQTIDTLYYPYLLRVRYTPPRLLSLVCFDCVFTIIGRHLEELRKLVRDHLVSEVQVFDARCHHAPPAHTPLIEKITIEPRRPPDAPTMH